MEHVVISFAPRASLGKTVRKCAPLARMVTTVTRFRASVLTVILAGLGTGKINLKTQ